MHNSDTIAAIATPTGRGGVAVIRLSGPEAHAIGRQICGEVGKDREAAYRAFRDQAGDTLDFGLAIAFRAPASFTGEDVFELQGHGGPVIAAMILEQCLQLGARRARPGEFSERAYLNDKMDLAQAEAVADMIQSGTREAALAAARSLAGEFSIAVVTLVERLTELRMFVEAAIDFPEEEIDFLADHALVQRIDALTEDFARLLRQARQGQILNDGLQVVLRGLPNAGKSSLMNALAGAERAIVTDVPGTTRDVLQERLSIDGIPITLLDTAGIRETRDLVEREGVRRANAATADADLALVVLDTADATPEVLRDQLARLRADLPPDVHVIGIANKIDLLDGARVEQLPAELIPISATRNDGISLLKSAIRARCGFGEATEGSFSARQRHLDALRRAADHFETGCQVLRESRAGELLAEELKAAQQALGEITGEFSSDDLLGKIFGEFCIGK